ncbi:hypothetical protein [Mesorhizobium sp. BH1-1-4]|uniref:hypothetical protein n=1 Tax=Mesorhizobium sp. BH1-1-4 TaxID=2876662 RepID=UPI001CD18E19|nr:hypothetical protein [Mesorhizobium sp. BH1-1-4]MBZ9993088.1 hypothetical protein [Mesorhizobium sp. BH1-1-4]
MSMNSDDLEGQFVVSLGGVSPAGGSHRHKLASLAVDIFPGVDLIPVIDGGGRTIGALLGTAIDLDNESIVTGQLRLEGTLSTSQDVEPFLEKNIYRLAGSFLFVLDVRGMRRIYLDADATMSLVYDPEAEIAGSSAAPLFDAETYRGRFRTDLYNALDVDNAGWFTAGLTAHRGLHRLLCNHYLDLETWVAVRHWPRQQIADGPDASMAYRQISDQVTRAIRALAKSGNACVALTAGNDSRFLLACCRDLVNDVSFVTVDAPGAELDVACARNLATRFGLRHKVLPFRLASAVEQERWQFRAGHCVGGANMKMHPSVSPLEGKYFVGGLGGEIGRGFLWLKAESDTAIDAANIVARLKLPQHPAVLEAVDAWLFPLLNYDSLFILDLAYLELRMSAWGFADSYVKPKQKEINPMISRANYVNMLSVPSRMRREREILLKEIGIKWPDVLAIPINRYGDMRDKLKFVRDVFSNPRRAIRKVSQIVYAGAR